MFQLSTAAPLSESAILVPSRTLSVPLRWALVLLPLCFLRLGGLTHQSLWYDEGYTLTLVSAHSFRTFLQVFGGYTTSEHLQPLYYFFMYLWSRFSGTSDIALRLPSALFSIGSGVAVYSLCQRLPRMRNAYFPLLASAAITVSSFSVYYAQEARPYALIQFLSFSLLALWVGRTASSPFSESPAASPILFSIACAGCMLASVFSALLILSLALADLIVDRSLARWFRSWSEPLLSAAAGVALYLALALRSFPSFIAKDITAIKQPLWMNIAYSIYGVLFGTTLEPSNALLRGPHKLHVVLAFWPIIASSALVLAALAIGAAYLLRTASNLPPASTALAIAAALYSVIFFGLFGIAGHLNILPRHTSALFSLLFVLGILCATALTLDQRPRGSLTLSIGIFGWIAINLLSLLGYRTDPAFRKDDYRATAQLFRQTTPAAPIFMPAGQPLLMQHYGVSVIDANSVDPQNLAQFLGQKTNKATQIYLVMNEYRGFRWDHSASPVEVLAPQYHCVVQRQFAYMQLIACQTNASLQSAAQRPAPLVTHPRLAEPANAQ